MISKKIKCAPGFDNPVSPSFRQQTLSGMEIEQIRTHHDMKSSYITSCVIVPSGGYTKHDISWQYVLVY